MFHSRIGDVSGGGKLASDMREIWVMQPRFEKRTGSAPWGMVDQARFRAAFDFMRLRADIGEVEELLADWWQEFSMADDNARQDLIDQVRDEQQKRQRAPKVQRAPRPVDAPKPVAVAGAAAPSSAPRKADGEGEFESAESEGGDAGAPRKRRRRRRTGGKGLGAGGDTSPSGGGDSSGN